MRRRSLSVPVLLGAACLALAPKLLSAADDTEAWRYQCLGDEVVGSTICTTELAVLEAGQEFIVYFVHGGKGTPPLVVSGESEAIGAVTIAVDKEDTLASERCEEGACFFEEGVSKTLMRQFRKGFRAKVTIRDTEGRLLFDRVLSLRGFTAALTKPRR